MWRSGQCGSLCALLLLVGWLSSAIDGVFCVAASLCLWAGRNHVPKSASSCLRLISLAMGALVIAWVFIQRWPTLTSPLAASGAEIKTLYLARRIMGLDGVPVIFAYLVYWGIVRSRSIAVPGAIALVLGTVTALAAPGALEDHRAEGTTAQIAEFAEWRDAIPRGANVFVANRYYSAGFTWFTLQRPSYLTVDQSSGVIFSSVTAAGSAAELKCYAQSKSRTGVSSPDALMV